MLAAIEGALDGRVRPLLYLHGGNVEGRAGDDARRVHPRFVGACGDCLVRPMTLAARTDDPGLPCFRPVVHTHNMATTNLRSRPDAQHAQDCVVRLGQLARSPKRNVHVREWTVEDMARLLFEVSDTDMAMAQIVPLFDWWVDSFALIRAQYELARAFPDRVLFCGGVGLLPYCGSEKPLWGSEAALHGSPPPYLEAFLKPQIPEDLQ